MKETTQTPKVKTLKVKTGAEKLRVSFKGYKGELGKANAEQLRTYVDKSPTHKRFVVEE